MACWCKVSQDGGSQSALHSMCMCIYIYTVNYVYSRFMSICLLKTCQGQTCRQLFTAILFWLKPEACLSVSAFSCDKASAASVGFSCHFVIQCLRILIKIAKWKTCESCFTILSCIVSTSSGWTWPTGQEALEEDLPTAAKENPERFCFMSFLISFGASLLPWKAD